jgi:hypothetical protein
VHTFGLQFPSVFVADSLQIWRSNVTIANAPAGNYFIVLDLDADQTLASTHFDSLTRRAASITVCPFGPDIGVSLAYGRVPTFISASPSSQPLSRRRIAAHAHAHSSRHHLRILSCLPRAHTHIFSQSSKSHNEYLTNDHQ